ncbi:MAG: Rne/Rng family ribonuclease [Pseudomonadota bacterium]|nr:Rne/Rng family ribonuclease [Pseudomonadota bacterium]
MKKMLIDAAQRDLIRVAMIEDKSLIDYESERVKNERIKGNIYLAKIVRVEPSLQAAFVDYGGKKHGFLAYNEIHPDYFKIPTADKKKLLQQELEDSKTIQIDEDETFLDEQFNNQDSTDQEEKKSDINKGFLNKVFDFFNYKPIDDFPIPKEKRRKRYKSAPLKNKQIIFHRKYSIQEVIKSNQVILIQVVKEERGNKGAAVTTRLSLAGKYCVLMPNTNKGGGISRKIEDIKLRKKLKDVVSKLNIKKGMGVIIRTAGQIMGIKEIKRDYSSLIKLWSEITSKTIKSNAPCLIHEEDNIIKRCLRDYFDSSFDEILINEKETINKSKEIVKQFMPNSLKSLKLYKDKKPLFAAYGLEKKIISINNPIVYLKSGGYLVINQTEALVSIDINSGKYTKQRNIEDTAFKTNLEAAEEIGKQLKIRDLAGLIVIDFIDMLDRFHNIKVERKLKEYVRHDRARVQIGRISNFGLLELSRQRLKVTTDTVMSVRCHSCSGYGSIISQEFLLEQLLKVCNEFSFSTNHKNIFLLASKNLVDSISNKIKDTKLSINLEKKLVVKNYPNLKENEYLICSGKEILYKNCHDSTNIDDFSIFSTSSKNKVKGLDEKKVEKIENRKIEKLGENKELENQPQIKKRVSYRAKAEGFGLGKSKDIKAYKKDKNINVLPKPQNKKSEKKQGWWNQ